jgi:hypothetical protein
MHHGSLNSIFRIALYLLNEVSNQTPDLGTAHGTFDYLSYLIIDKQI